MADEIERKFLVHANLDDLKRISIRDHQWFGATTIHQVYLLDTGSWAIRARKEANWSAGFRAENGVLVPRDDWDRDAHFTLTMKQRRTAVTNKEIETGILRTLYDEMEAECGHRPLRKTRWTFYQARRFTVDEFLNPELDGLVMAEIELKSEDEEFDRPDWLGEEVTGRKEYSNHQMVEKLRV